MKVAIVLSLFVSVFISIPLWLYIMYAVLHALGDSIPHLAWVAYYMYVPTVFFQVLNATVIRLMEKEGEK